MDVLELSEIFHKTATRKWKIDSSPIHGNGVFAMQDFTTGEKIGLVLINKDDGVFQRTLLGHHINHQPSQKANSSLMKNEKGDYYLIATKYIEKEKEITLDYGKYKHQMATDGVKEVV